VCPAFTGLRDLDAERIGVKGQMRGRSTGGG
jgi:hypothetical protein